MSVVDVDSYRVAGGAQRFGGTLDFVSVGLTIAAAGDTPYTECAKPTESGGFEDGVGAVSAGGAVYEGSFSGGVGDFDSHWCCAPGLFGLRVG
ncbi:hypothetical protein, partial [Mycobacterium intracellulare]|uniref:hypothetical protein n=1 Tax=Mycobacterium intracellulare TaxID=1767 RepID=UPI001E2FDFB7